MTTTTTDELLTERRGNVLWITFNRPQARNAMTFAMYERLDRIALEANEDPSLRAIVLTGAGGKAFVAGTDISQFRSFNTPEDALGYEERMDRILGNLERIRVPTIAAIAGACTGGGAAIAAGCDLRIGSPSAKFGFPIARTLGNCLSMGNYARLVALLGVARTKDLIFTARFMDAQEGLATGLLSEVTPDEASLPVRAEQLATLLASHAPLTLRATKEALLRIQQRLVPEKNSDLVLMCYMSQDFKEGIEAFFEKRKADWKGE
ncbi:enoyl-CoA hydratase [bacterium]|nr:MAG: enoyl-CoA hydratase [bacterium]